MKVTLRTSTNANFYNKLHGEQQLHVVKLLIISVNSFKYMSGLNIIHLVYVQLTEQHNLGNAKKSQEKKKCDKWKNEENGYKENIIRERLPVDKTK